jgi:hypothetical protein
MKHTLTLLAALLLALQFPLLAADVSIFPHRYVPLYEQIFTSNEASAARRGAFDKPTLRTWLFDSVKARDARSFGKRRWRYHRNAAGLRGTAR